MFATPIIPYSESGPSAPAKDRQNPAEVISGTNTIDRAELKNGGGRVTTDEFVAGTKGYQYLIAQPSTVRPAGGKASVQKAAERKPQPPKSK